MAKAALGWLATADATALTGAEQADCLRVLEQAAAAHTAARARVLAAFCTGGGYEDDGVRHEAPVLPGRGERPRPLACRSRLVKLRAAGPRMRTGRREQP